MTYSSSEMMTVAAARAHPAPDRAALLATMRALWRGPRHREERYAAMELPRSSAAHRKLVDLEMLPLLEEMIVEFSNQLRRQGMAVHEAVVTAASLRLRPILMTTFAMVLGALPLALASGAGAESRRQIGWVIVGGMSLGTILTIFVVPTVYTWFARNRVPGEITEAAIDEVPVPAK